MPFDLTIDDRMDAPLAVTGSAENPDDFALIVTRTNSLIPGEESNARVNLAFTISPLFLMLSLPSIRRMIGRAITLYVINAATG